MNNLLESESNRYQLPLTGLKRASEILPFLPFKKSTLWAWSKDGRFPKPVRMGTITCWSCESIHEWLNAHDKTELPEAANDIGDKN